MLFFEKIWYVLIFQSIKIRYDLSIKNKVTTVHRFNEKMLKEGIRGRFSEDSKLHGNKNKNTVLEGTFVCDKSLVKNKKVCELSQAILQNQYYGITSISPHRVKGNVG